MADQINQEDIAIRYLLGSLSETEEMRLEEQILSNDEVFETLEIAEGEVIDRYVRDELNEKERERVQEMISNSPRLAERAEVARILAGRGASPEPQQNDPQSTEPVKREKKKTHEKPWWNFFGPMPQLAPSMRLLMVTPLVLLVLTSGGLLLVWTRYRAESQRWTQAEQRLAQLRKQLDEQNAKSSGLEDKLKQTEQDKAAQETLVASLQQQLEELHAQTPSIFSVFINPGVGTRGGGGGGETNINIPSGTNEVELRLNVESGDYSQYEATLKDLDSKPIFKRGPVKPIHRGSRKFIPFKVAAKKLPPGSYYIHVDGLTGEGVREDFNDYQLRVTAR